MTKLAFTTIRETKKALFIEIDGQQGWIQKRWGKDGMVSVTTWEKAVASQKANEEFEQKQKEIRNSFYDLSEFVSGVTASGKAEIMEITLYEEHSDQKINKAVFLPISMKKDGKYPGWLLQKKREELFSELESRYAGAYFHTFFEGSKAHDFFQN